MYNYKPVFFYKFLSWMNLTIYLFWNWDKNLFLFFYFLFFYYSPLFSREAVLCYLSIYWEISLLAFLNLGQPANVMGAP